MARNCTLCPWAGVGSASRRAPRITPRRGSTVRSITEQSTPARSTQMRMHPLQRYALIAGSQACANLENCERDNSEVTSYNAPCSQRNFMFLIGSIVGELQHRLACSEVQTRKRKSKFQASNLQRKSNRQKCP